MPIKLRSKFYYYFVSIKLGYIFFLIMNRFFTFVIKIASSIENESRSALQVQLPGSIIFHISVKPMSLANFCRMRKLAIGSDNSSLHFYGTFIFILLILTNALKIENMAADFVYKLISIYMYLVSVVVVNKIIVICGIKK